MSDTTQLVKERLDAVDFLKTYVNLLPAGKNFKGLCPFHKEKTPSFIVSPDRQIWHCFGCGAGGDIISFLMRYENIEFFEALKILAERAGVDVRASGADQRQYAVLYDINKAAKEFFREYLYSDAAPAKAALDYLTERGLKPETIQEFELGLAPNASDALSRQLIKSGYKISDIERAGLVYKTERGTYWDRFRNRIMFPLHNHFGKCAGFTGRLTAGADAEGVGKYVNSPETPIFNKSRLLFGFNKSKNSIREAKAAVFVEGQMDLVFLWQDGVKNAVATSGTSLTKEHLKTVKRLADTIVIAFDNDEAGLSAAERVIDLANEHDFTVKILNQESIDTRKIKDPADIVKNYPGIMPKLISGAKPALEHYFNRYLGTAAGGETPAFQDIANLKRNIRIILSKIKAISSAVERSHWINKLSELVNISEEHLFDEMAALKTTGTASGRENIDTKANLAENREFPRSARISERLISLAIVNPDFKEKLKEHASFLGEPYRRVTSYLLEGAKLNLAPDLQELADVISLRSSFELTDKADMRKEFEELTRNLKLEYYKGQREALSAKIKNAEQSGDERGLAESLREFDRISKEIYNI